MTIRRSHSSSSEDNEADEQQILIGPKADSCAEGHDSTHDASDEALERTLSLSSGVAMIVGVMIGSGIFAFPGSVLRNSPTVGLSLAAWVIAGILALSGALSYAELGTAIPSSGADQAYLKRAYSPFEVLGINVGELLSFLFCWTNVIVSRPASIAIISLVFGEYLDSFVTGTHRHSGAFGALCLLFVAATNIVSVKAAVAVQDALMWVKVVALAAIAIAGGILLANQGSFADVARPETPSATMYGVALQGACLRTTVGKI